MLLDGCKKLGSLGLSWFNIFLLYCTVGYCNYLPQHCRNTSSIKNDIPLDWAVLFVLHELFLPILGQYFLLFMIFPPCLRENMTCRLGELFCYSARLTLGGALPLALSVRMRRLHSSLAWVESEEGSASQFSIATSNGFS